MGRYVNSSAVCTTQQSCTIEIYGTSGASCAWIVPTGVSTATFEIWGGGGAGGPKCCCYCGWSAGGFGGGYSLKTTAVISGATYTVCAGAGGTSVYCSVSGSNVGCAGCPSYVTGTGLSNFCATGGAGGYFCCQGTFSAVCCGGLSYGGDVNLTGGFGWNASWSSNSCSTSTGGPSPMGGRSTVMVANNCQQSCRPGCCGAFPGGGGSGFVANCCDCCVCNGGGAPGLVRITF